MRFDINILLCFTMITLVGVSCSYDSREAEPVQDCRTDSVTFSLTVQPILMRNCSAVCHSGPMPANDLDLSQYVQVLTVAKNGMLSGAIKHLSGYSPMPK